MLRIKKVCYLVQQNTQHCVSIDSVIHGVAVNTHMGVGIAQRLAHQIRDQKVVGSNPCRSSRRFSSPGPTFCADSIWYLCHPCVTVVACKRPQSCCQKCRWQVTAKYACNLHMWLCMKWHGAWLHGVHRTHWDSSSFMWHQPCQRCKYTTLVDIQKCAIKS